MTDTATLATSVVFEDILAARDRIADGVFATPCRESADLSQLTGCEIYSKLEYQQRTGSFKERGARNALLLLDPARRARGVVAASAGNHALALAFHGRQLGIPVTVVMPTFAPLVKRTKCERLGARVLLHGENIAEAKVKGDELVASEGLTYIHGFNDAAIIAGQGTMGLEILEQVHRPDAIVVPIGGAGLIAGVALAVKHLAPRTEVIGVEPRRCPSFSEALKVGRPVRVQTTPTLADGLAVPEVGDRAFAIARDRVDRVVQVDEEEISLSMLRLLELEKGVVEGGGASSLAPFLTGQLADLKGKRVVLALCGGNVDPTVLSRVIDHGLALDGRLTRFTAVIRDRPGGLAAFAGVVAEAGASIKQIQHERAFGGPDVSTVQVDCTAEVRDLEHIRALHRSLESHGFRILSKSHG
jgi:threonine dehydratase